MLGPKPENQRHSQSVSILYHVSQNGGWSQDNINCHGCCFVLSGGIQFTVGIFADSCDIDCLGMVVQTDPYRLWRGINEMR